MDFLRNGGQSADNRDFTVCIILEWTTSLDTSSKTLFVCLWGCPRHVERRVTYHVRLLLNVELRNFVISPQNFLSNNPLNPPVGWVNLF